MNKKIKILIGAVLFIAICAVIIVSWQYKKSRAIAYECYYSTGNNYARCVETTTLNGGIGGCYGSNELAGNRPEDGIKIQTKGIITNLCDGFDRSNMRLLYYDSKGSFIK
jgi:hypothetical protein